MPAFKYKIIDREGRSNEGIIEAESRFEVYDRLREKGERVVYVKEEGRGAFTLDRIGRIFSKVRTQDKINFAKNLSAMIKAGLPMTRALSVMERQAKKNGLKNVLASLSEDISKGKSLSESMRSLPDVFSQLFISMVRAGEESGKLSESLSVVGMQMEKAYLLAKKVRGAMIYPAVIVTIMILIGVLMLVYMVPTLTATFQGLGVDLPASTRAVVAASDFLRTQYLAVAAVLIALFSAVILGMRTAKGRRALHFIILRIPLIGNIAREVNAARTARTLASLLSSGVDVVVSIEVAEDIIQNVYFKEVLAKAQKNIEKGESMASAFIENEKLYPVFVGEMISVGEETGQLSQMLTEVAGYYEEEVDQKTKNMSTLIEPFLMVLMGVAVGFFAIAMLAPTYSLVDAI